MNTSFLIIFIVAVGFTIWEIFYTLYFIKKGKLLSKKVYSGKFEIGNKSKPGINVLISGDSIGAGVGASSFETSVAGRIGHHLSKKNYVSLNNISVSGSRIKHILERLIPEEKQDLTILFISSNDVTRFTKLKSFRHDAEKALEKYSKSSKKLLLVGPGNVALARVLPLFLRLKYTYRIPKYAALLNEVSANFPNITYINSTKPPKTLGKYKESYYSHDMFHPNDRGHEYWFEIVKPYL